MPRLGDITIAELNEALRLFGDSQKRFMRQEKRASLRSMLFDVPRRSSIGWHCFYQEGPRFLEELSRHISPEEIGRRMKRLCSRPYYLTLSIVFCSYFNARQQLLLDAGLQAGEPFPGERLQDAKIVADFWRRAASAYRNDGQWLPAQGSYTQAILAEESVRTLGAHLRPTTQDERKTLRRLAATLELYCFILHGEQRDGIFAHGPYDAGDGAQIVVQEFTDLQNDFLPWAATPARNRYPNIALALKLRGVRTRFDVFGSVLFDPADILPGIEAEGIFTCGADGVPRPVPLAEVAEIQHCAAEAQNELYQKAAEWTPRYKAEYGAQLFANHLVSFFELLPGGQRYREPIRAAFDAAALQVLDRWLGDPEPPSMWKFMGTTEGEFFWPVAGAETAESMRKARGD
ncbi:MAG: hypothetical protein LAN84_15365 [Acidobacteriia bacterium]|nr:hypothetical protein [Terriglobia bacterium]